jgi:hypothetical protein
VVKCKDHGCILHAKIMDAFQRSPILVGIMEKSGSWFGDVTEISELLWFLPFYGCLTREKGLPCINIQ